MKCARVVVAGAVVGALVLVSMPAVAVAFTVYRCDFETYEGYTTGGLNGQNGWVADAGTAVQAGQASSGSQGIQMVPQGNYTGQFITMALRSLADPTAEYPLVTVTQDVLLTAQGEAAWQIVAMGGFLPTNRVEFTRAGDIIINGTDTGHDWLAGQWEPLAMVMNFGDNTTDVFYGGTRIADDAAFMFTGAGLTSLVLATDDYVDAGSTGYYDNLLITATEVPEPATVALLLAGLAGVVSRRRR